MLKIPARFKQCDLSVSLAFDYCDCIVNMGTRAAAFTAKIRSLYDYQLRLMQGTLPPPSGVDIANTIKYFSQTLLSVLKDVQNSPFDLLKNPEMDSVRIGLFQNLDYKGLYNSIIPLIEVAPLITNGLHVFGQALLQCLGCLLPFLDHDLIDNLPYLTASTIAVLPPSLHQDIINTLCYYILPFTITRHDPKQADICQSVSAVIMMIFQYSTNPAHHCQLLECLMTLKQNTLQDMLSAIAYGTSNSRASAAKLLFYYWPTFNANLFDRKNLICKFAEPNPFVCQRDECPNSGNAEAAKVCYDHCIAIQFSTDIPPPLYLCIECANEIHREHPNQRFFDVLHLMQQVSMVCENKNCRSNDKSAISICFSTECASYNGNHPIRYCEQCHNNRHNSRRGGDHIVHKAIPPTWEMDPEMQTCMVEAIVSLLKESKIPESELKEIDRKEIEERSDKKESKEGKEKEKDGKSPIPALDNISVEERQLLGRYGVWLLVGRCNTGEKTQTEVLGRLLAMIFHWFHMTAYSYDGREESALEKLKMIDVCGWLKEPPPEPETDDVHSRKSPPENEKKEKPSELVLNMPIPEVPSVGGVLVHMPHIMTATVETVSEQLDLASIMPAEKVVSAVTRVVTLSETDIATATVSIGKSQPSMLGETNEQPESDSGGEEIDFWQTSIGKFKFSLEDLPEPIQFIHQLLMELSKVTKPDILYYMLKCLNVLILYGDACTKASKENKGFFIWCQEHLTIKNLWNLLNSEHSHICQEAVPLLLHCITLPAGPDVFWRIIQDDFHNQDWRVRFTAVERVTVLARFMADCPLKNQMQLQAAMANAFCFLISSMDDPNVYVAQRATLYLGTIHDFAVRSLILCLESQFDSVILDRPMVLQSIYQLHNSLSERKILCWDFFLNRFDTLFIEAQIALEKAGDITYIRDLKNTDVNSEIFIKKLHRAHNALSSLNEGSISSSIKTLSASFGTKWPYKRTMSAPASIIRHQESKSVHVPETKEKVYSRQYSAPILKRKSSRFGLDGHMHSLNAVDDQNLSTFLQRIIDLEEADKETMHLLVFLLMQFLSRSDQAYPADEKNLGRTQTIVLKHLWLLLGYSQTDRGIYIPPQSLRASPAFNVFLANLPQLMDQNHLMGRIIFPTCLIMLQYAPSPYYIPSAMDFQQPLHSLWALEPHARKNWLMSLVVILYKYQYSQQPHCIHLIALIRIVLNTLDSQHHHCRRIPATIIMGQQSSRSRDVSQPSLGTEMDHPERTTPPLSPMYSSDGQSIQVSLSSKGGKVQVSYTKPLSMTGMETHWEETNQNEKHSDEKWEKSFRKQGDKTSIDDDTESELLAIPESDISDSTLQGSGQDSFEEVLALSENSGIMKQVTEKAIVTRSPKESVSSLSEIKRICSNKGRPVWIIGSEDESIRSCDHKMQELAKAKMELNKNCARIKSNSSSGSINLTYGSSIQSVKHISNSSRKQIDSFQMSRPSRIGMHKKLIEPSVTASSTSVFDYDNNKNNHLPTPSIERLLPIGPIKSPDLDDVFSPLEPHLEIPTQERLLPIGQHTKDISHLVEKVKQALNINSKISKKTEIQENNIFEQPSTSQTHSPRKLIKQVALESPPNLYESDDNGNGLDSYLNTIKVESQRDAIVNHRQRIRKTCPLTPNSQHQQKPKLPGGWMTNSQITYRKTDTNCDSKQSSYRIGDESVKERCSECGTARETYSDEEVGLCIVALGTFIHREPSLAAPLLPDILSIIAKIATNAFYPWQCESSVHLPGGAVSVAHQFLRCVLHQLAPNGIFIQMFQTKASDHIRLHFFKSVIQALIDFNELNPVAPLQLLLETLNFKKTLPTDMMPTILSNMAAYLSCLPLESALGPTTPMWSTVLQQLEIIYRKLLFMLNTLDDVTPLLNIMASIFKLPLITQFKGILEPFSKVLSYAIQTHTLQYNLLVEICYLCNKAFTKDRDRLIFSRMVVIELVQVLKFKTTIPDSNLLMLINLILQDVGGHIPSNVVIKESNLLSFETSSFCSTGISECMKLNLVDILEFLSDFHTISKMKSYCKGIGVGLNDDTLGGIIKCSVAQYLALEITKGNSRDSRAVARYFPWLYSTSVSQQSPREFVECIGHIRLLSWLLLGSLTHTALQGSNTSTLLSQPIPQEASCQIADNIQVIMSGFADQPKASVLHMSSLFHTFILCQLWTVYLEQSLSHHQPVTETYNVTMNILFDFWGKVTPCILQLVQKSKTLSEIVSLHFLSMLEALIECQSTFVTKLLPLWTPVLSSNQIQLPGHLLVRLQNCRNFSPTIYQEVPNENRKIGHLNNPMLLKWLQRLQFKMGQIELQSSAATQFYSL
ncbi:unnamed protein product [Ceutorhynchus assimilis]|uniref:Protein unc-79 homolog n=1 Tax=Ceutorhynchus assimilis TaxID=467358 RepID=A0A9P0DG51_9CUCU|nr:unnamed protein product [Ceutorhynchus assimilis]